MLTTYGLSDTRGYLLYSIRRSESLKSLTVHHTWIRIKRLAIHPRSLTRSSLTMKVIPGSHPRPLSALTRTRAHRCLSRLHLKESRLRITTTIIVNHSWTCSSPRSALVTASHTSYNIPISFVEEAMLFALARVVSDQGNRPYRCSRCMPDSCRHGLMRRPCIPFQTTR